MSRIITSLIALLVALAPLASAAGTTASLVSPDGKSDVLVLRSATAATYCAYVNDISSAANVAEAERIGTASPYNAIPAKAGTQVTADTANTVTIQCSGVKLKLIPVTSSDAAFKPLKDKPGYVPPESIRFPNS